MDGTTALGLLDEVAVAIQAALGAITDWGLAGTRAGQYKSDLAADAAALEVLEAAGVGVLSEESGRHWPDRPVTVVLDPLDGSTNASRGIPWFATSLCAVDADGPLAALVVNLPSGSRASATRGGGSFVDGVAVSPSGCEELGAAVVGLSGMPPHWLGWKQYRALGACALDLGAVANGTLDAYLDCSWSAHGPWDYLGGVLLCTEAGAVVADGELLLVRQTYRTGLGLPGGLLDRGESPEAAVVREIYEEAGLAVVTLGRPAVVVEPALRRVDVCFRCEPAPGIDRALARPSSPEIREVRWVPLVALEGLQPEAVSGLQELGFDLPRGVGLSRRLRRTRP